MNSQTAVRYRIPLAILAFLLISSVLSSPVIDRRFARGAPAVTYKNLDLNQTIDDNLSLLRGGLKLMGPSNLKNVSFPLIEGIGVTLYNGSLNNLAQVKRVGPCTASVENKVVIVKGVFGWDNLTFDYNYSTEIWVISVSGKLLGDLKDLKVAVAVKIDAQNHQVILEQLEFVDAGHVKVEFEGNMMDTVSNQAMAVMAWMGRDLILKKVVEEIESFMELDMTELNKLLPELDVAPYQFINNVPATRDEINL